MKQRTPHLSAWLLLALSSVFLGKTLVTAAEPAGGPELSLTLFEPEAAPSWQPTQTLAIRVDVTHPASSSETASRDPLTLAPAGQAWPASVSLRITDPDGREVSWPLVRSGTSRVAPFPLNVGGSLSMAFVMSADPDRRISPGDYRVVAAMQIRDGTGWVGRSESPPLTVKVAEQLVLRPGLEISVTGGTALAVGDPWVVELRLPPPLGSTAEDLLRSGYRLRVFDASGQEQPWAFEPAVTLPSLPEPRELIESGLYPVLAVLAPSAATGLQPGTYRLEASWSGAGSGAGRTNSLSVTVNSLSTAEGLAERRAAVLQQRLGWATALLWRAEFSSTADIERLTREAAPLLVAAEKNALDAFVQDTKNSEAALALSETYLLGGDFEGALAFAHLARRSRPQLQDSIDSPPDEIWQLLGEYGRMIEQAAAQAPGRVLPYLRPAIEAARPPDLTAQWAATARASSEYRASDYGAVQAAGAPNVSRYGDNARAWASKTADAGEEWLELTFAEAVRAEGLRIIQNFNPGALVSIELLSEDGEATIVWTGPDRTIYAKSEIGILTVSFPRTPQPVKRVRLVLDTKSVTGWNEIDAVQLLAARTSTNPPRLQFQVSSTEPGVLELSSWPAGYILQRATRLSPSDWTTFAPTPPARFLMQGEAAYFRLLRTP